MKLTAHNPALTEARTIHVKFRRDVQETKRLLKDVAGNSKLGKGHKRITKGAWQGFPMFALTLEERATCSNSCKQWAQCFGNNMPLAHRINHADPLFLGALLEELHVLQKKHPKGFVVRLHVLGDFYSVEYVEFWKQAMIDFPALHLFGFTHRMPEDIDGIGAAVFRMNGSRCWIRFSDRGGEMSANVDTGEGVQCPQQTGKTESCLTCALCWSTKKAINFISH